MNNSIYPCLWFDKEAHKAAAFYCDLFPNSKMEQQNSFLSTCILHNTKFMMINGGPHYKMTPAVSYYVYCGGEKEISRLYSVLSQEATVLMPLADYAWSPKYAWLQDKFGVNWQLDVHDINSSQKIVPSFLFANEKMHKLKTALKYYPSVFKNSKVLMETPYPEDANMPEEALLFAQFKLNDFILNGMSSNIEHDFDFTPGNSLVVECETQEEIDHYWEKLGKDGRHDRCGWLVDQFGISWQIIPAILSELVQDPEKGPRVQEAFMKMTKFDIETLLKA